MLKKIAFLDRDGVINVDKNYVYKILDFEWIKEAKEAIKYLNKKDYLVIVVSNQSGIARGLYTEKDVNILHQYINEELIKVDAYIDEFFYSPFHPKFKTKKYEKLKNLRKPNTGMLELAEKKWNIDKLKSFLIGDKIIDMECAKSFGIEGYLYKGGSLLDFVLGIDNI